MRYRPCQKCGERTFSYLTHPLIPDEDGNWTPEESWVHLHPVADQHAAVPVLDPLDSN